MRLIVYLSGMAVVIFVAAIVGGCIASNRFTITPEIALGAAGAWVLVTAQGCAVVGLL